MDGARFIKNDNKTHLHGSLSHSRWRILSIQLKPGGVAADKVLKSNDPC